MNFPKNIIVDKITHVSVVNFQIREKSKMTSRPWYGIAFSLGGKLTYVNNSKKISLCGNNVVFLPENATYDVCCTESGAFAVINFICNKDLLINEFLSLETSNLSSLKKCFTKMQTILEAGSENYSLFSEFYKLLSLLICEVKETYFPPVLVAAMNYIENNISESNLCNLQIAENIGISEVYLRKIFKKFLSVSVGEYTRDKRIAKAQRLLCETSLSITEISEKCGYSCIYYFCKAFRQKCACTPTEYRLKCAVGLF